MNDRHSWHARPGITTGARMSGEVGIPGWPPAFTAASSATASREPRSA